MSTTTTDGFWLGDEDGDRINLADVEPFRYHVGDMPVTRIEYRANSVTIEWATEAQLASWKFVVDDL